MNWILSSAHVRALSLFASHDVLPCSTASLLRLYLKILRLWNFRLSREEFEEIGWKICCIQSRHHKVYFRHNLLCHTDPDWHPRLSKAEFNSRSHSCKTCSINLVLPNEEKCWNFAIQEFQILVLQSTMPMPLYPSAQPYMHSCLTDALLQSTWEISISCTQQIQSSVTVFVKLQIQAGYHSSSLLMTAAFLPEWMLFFSAKVPFSCCLSCNAFSVNTWEARVERRIRHHLAMGLWSYKWQIFMEECLCRVSASNINMLRLSRICKHPYARTQSKQVWA